MGVAFKQVPGFCQPTTHAGNCKRGNLGFWDLHQFSGIRTLDDCISYCKRCPRCAVVSFSRAHHDCSWYSRCDLAELQVPPESGPDYVTVRVRSAPLAVPRRSPRDASAARFTGRVRSHCLARDAGNASSFMEQYLAVKPAVRDAYRAFFLTRGYGEFWGSGAHIEGLVRAVHSIAPASALRHEREFAGASFIDAGAGRYNVAGGDISHFMLYLQLWGCPPGGALFGFEPMERPFLKLADELRKTLAPPLFGRESPRGADGARGFEVVRVGRQRNRTCAVLSQAPLSEREADLVLDVKPHAGANTASLEPTYQQLNQRADREMARRSKKHKEAYEAHRRERIRRSTTIDLQLAQRGLLPRVMILKVDVEGHEMAVLRGASEVMRRGRAHLIILEYGHSTSPPIWEAMKAQFSDAPAAPTPQQVNGSSLYATQRWADRLGYETFLVGGHAARVELTPRLPFIAASPLSARASRRQAVRSARRSCR